jgi:hypothetical protein
MRFIKPLVKIPAHLGNGERNDAIVMGCNRSVFFFAETHTFVLSCTSSATHGSTKVGNPRIVRDLSRHTGE